MKKSGFVTIIGRPSVGKSTLLNRMCGEKVAIVSSVPQTTRNAIRGIVNRDKGQLIFVDTPGRHSSEKKINKKLMEVSDRALQECDLILYILDAARAPGEEEADIITVLKPLIDKTIIAINKIDVTSADIDKIKIFLNQNFFVSSPSESSVSSAPLCEHPIYLISASTGEGVDELLDALYEKAPQGQAMYDEEYYTDQDTEFRIAEIIREQAINRLRQELPHSLYVSIEDMEFKEDEKNRQNLWVRAFIIVERESQKGMVVGKGGEVIKAIRLGALKDLKRIFDWKIDLDLRVKTGKDWRHNDYTLHRIIDRN